MNIPDSVDIVIIGGGISGLGVALEAALQGFSAALFEREGLAGATSNNSLRIIHGGIRYLQQLNLPRVLNSLRAQEQLCSDFPGIVKSLPCLMPLSNGGFKGGFSMRCAATLYNGLADYAGAGMQKAQVVSGDFVKQNATGYASVTEAGAFLWHDAIVLDPRELVSAVAEKARSCGASILEHARVTAVTREQNLFLTSFAHAGSKLQITSKVVVDCSGPWLDSLLDRSNRNNSELAEAWCKAFNIILKRQFDPHYAIGLHSLQKRLFFLVPRGSQTVIGTGYLPFQGPPEKATISPHEIEEFISDIAATWPDGRISNSDVEAVESGVLPMRHVGPLGPVLYGREKIKDRTGYLSVMSTKYTTFLVQARKVITMARPYLPKP